MEQRTEDWFAARCGKFTGSRFADLMATTRSGPSASRANLIATLALERLTGQPESTFQNDAMRRGTEMEPLARGAYEALTGDLVELVGFIQHPRLAFVGVSPDGLIGDDGMVELKCPASQAKHLSYLRHGAHADEYRWQIQGQMWVADRQWCDIVSFDPRFPDDLQLAVERVMRSEADFDALTAACAKANAEVDAIVEELKNMQRAA